MPYTVSSNADGCSGFAVVKEGENSPIPGGCHKTKSDAIAHMVALQAEYEDGESRQEMEMEDEGDDSEENLLPRQTAMYELYESIAESFGQWNQGDGADGAHYSQVSPFQDQGLICASCVFYEGGQRCEIVEGQIKPLGICKLWIIEESLLPATGIKFVDGEPEEEPAEYNTRASVNLVAPAFMKASARRGLALHEEGYSGDGLRPQTVEDARKMANGEALSPEKWRKISPWIARHTVDLDAVQGDEITAGLVAMLLWGGGSSKASASRAKSYAERIVSQLEESREQPRDKLGRFGSSGSTDLKDSPSVPERDKEFTAEVQRGHDAMVERAESETSGIEDLDESLYQYQSNGYKQINSAAQSMDKGEPVDRALKRDVQNLDEAIASVSMRDLSFAADYDGEPIDVFRGVTNIEKINVGDTLNSAGFTSTSLDPLRAMEFSHSAGAVLGMPKKPYPVLRISGAKNGLPIKGGEKEVLLARGIKMKVVGRSSVSVGSGEIETIDCEIVQ